MKTTNYVGKMSGLLNNPKKELGKKQDTMKEMSVDAVRSLYPPFSVKQELSKKAPVQITIKDSNSDSVSGINFNITKDTNEITSGITDTEGICVYNDPEVMTPDIMPCCLEYEGNEVSIEVPEDATYACIEVVGKISEVVDTDGSIETGTIGTSDELNNWNYTISSSLNRVTLNYYTGSEKNVIVHSKYEKDGNIYNTRIHNGNALSKADTVKWMFNAAAQTPCRYIESITFEKEIDCSSIYDMNRMFYKCSNLKQVNGLTNLDIPNVNNMVNMFYETSIESLDLSNWNVYNVVNLQGMFGHCKKLVSLNLANWSVGAVTTMKGMFEVCLLLKNLNLSNWDTSNVEDMSYMFSMYINFNYPKDGFLSLDLTSFNISKVTNMSYLFRYCTNLTEILVSRDKWIIHEGCNETNMFYNCGVDHVTYVD